MMRKSGNKRNVHGEDSLTKYVVILTYPDPTEL
jgi:hypothetical protein